MSTPHASAPVLHVGRAWLGFPKGTWLIIGVEFMERFSFYGMLSLLPLFLTDSPAHSRHGGFGWSATDALSLLGIYTFAMYAFPAAGGFFADRVLGRRRAVLLGATLMLIGQLLLPSPVYLPLLLGLWHGMPLLDTLHALGVPLGLWVGDSAVHDALLQHGPRLDPARGVEWLGQAYFAVWFGFYGAIFCLVLGNALMKATLVVLCGETMDPADPRREGAFTYYYLGISVGATLATYIVGSVAQAAGWHMGFAVTAAGMSVALAAYVLLGPRWLGGIGLRPHGPRGFITESAETAPAPPGETSRRILLLFVLALILCAFCIGWSQLFGSWSLFIEQDVERGIAGFVVPVPWFQGYNSTVVILSAPFIAALWVRLGERRQPIDIVQKYVFALATVALAHAVLYLTALHATPTTLAALGPLLIPLALIALGEIVAWTSTYGVVQRAAPKGYASVAMGAWYLMTLGLGGYLSGFAGRLIDTLGYAMTFAIIGMAMTAACLATLLLRAPLKRLAARADVTL